MATSRKRSYIVHRLDSIYQCPFSLATNKGLISDLEQQRRKLDLQKMQEVERKEHALEKIEIMKEATENLRTEWTEKVKNVQAERDRLQAERDELKKECNHGEER